MTPVSVKPTIKELELLTSVMSDQMLRKTYIEPQLPGHRSIVSEWSTCKILVARLQSLLNSGSVKTCLALHTAVAADSGMPEDCFVFDYEPACNHQPARHPRIAKYGMGG